MQNFNSLSIYFIKYCCIMSLIMVIYYIVKLYLIIMFYYNKNYIIPIYYPNKIKNWLLELKNSINISTPTHTPTHTHTIGDFSSRPSVGGMGESEWKRGLPISIGRAEELERLPRRAMSLTIAFHTTLSFRGRSTSSWGFSTSRISRWLPGFGPVSGASFQSSSTSSMILWR